MIKQNQKIQQTERKPGKKKPTKFDQSTQREMKSTQQTVNLESVKFRFRIKKKKGSTRVIFFYDEIARCLRNENQTRRIRERERERSAPFKRWSSEKRVRSKEKTGGKINKWLYGNRISLELFFLCSRRNHHFILSLRFFLLYLKRKMVKSQ